MKYLICLLVTVTLFSCNKVSKEPVAESESTENSAIDKEVHWSKNLSMYEVNIRQYTKEGTFNAFADHLPRLKELGIGILWFMPIQPIGELKRKGSLGSYYSIKNYKEVNPEFGSLEDFKRVVQKAHDLGMYVIIDWVPNHSAWDCNLVTEHPEWYTKDENGNMIPPIPDWSDVADFNYEDKGLWKYMQEAMKYWITETNIDGFRCDVAGEVPLPFWEETVAELRKTKADVFMLAEHEDPKHHSAFHMTYGWEMHHIMNQIGKGEMTLKDLRTYFEKEDTNYNQMDYRLHFITNHDENSWNGTVEERMGEAGNAFAVLSTTVEQSMPLVYSGQEAGLNKRLKFFEKDEIEWRKHPNTDLYRALIELKMENEALWNGEHGGDVTFIANDKEDQVLTFTREKNGEKIFAVINISPKQVATSIQNEDMGEMTEVFSKEKFVVGKNLKVTLKPWNYLLFSN